MSDTSHFLSEIRQGLVWKIVFEEYFHGKQNNLVSEYSRWCGAQEKNSTLSEEMCVRSFS